MPEVKTFRAANIQDALALVRQHLGSDAVILQTRPVQSRHLIPWRKRRNEIEVTATLDTDFETEHSDMQPISNGTLRPTKPVSPSALPSVPSVDRSRFAADVSRTAIRVDDAGIDLTAEVASRLDSIQQTLENLSRNQRVDADELRGELFHIYTDLVEADVEVELARELVSGLKRQGHPGQLDDPAAVQHLLTTMVESELQCCGPIRPISGRRKVVALIGATGVGKTTTIAKLAANFRLRDEVKMGLVTVDTYRVAAVEQLRIFAEIIDLPMKVVTNPTEMRRAMDEFVGLDLVLIDTAGRSPRDELQIQELKSLLSEADVDEVHLVLNMTGSLKSLEATAQKFSSVNTTALILTKLDEAAGMGAMLSLARRIPLPVSYLTTGQDVPDDIEPASQARMARLIVGLDRLGR